MLRDLLAIPLTVVPPTATADATFQVASKHGLSYYDAAYVALADSLDCGLVTADQRLVDFAFS